MNRIRVSKPVVALSVLAAVACQGPGAGRSIAPPPADTVLQIGGTGLFVHTEGSGPPLVVVHGGPLLDHGYLTEPLRPLADEFRLVFYDQRLSGRSEGRVDTSSVTLDRFAEDIEGIRVALGFDRIHLLGHSWGGLLAMKYALARPDRLRSLVLVSPMPPSAVLWQQEERTLRAALEPADTAGMGAVRASPELAAGDPAAIRRLLQLSFRAQLHDPTLADSLEFMIPADYGERSRQFSLLGRDLRSYDLLPGLAGLGVPTLVAYGASEPAAATTVDTLLATIPGAEARAIPDAGHFAFVERPDAFRRIVRTFLREHP